MLHDEQQLKLSWGWTQQQLEGLHTVPCICRESHHSGSQSQMWSGTQCPRCQWSQADTFHCSRNMWWSFPYLSQWDQSLGVTVGRQSDLHKHQQWCIGILQKREKSQKSASEKVSPTQMCHCWPESRFWETCCLCALTFTSIGVNPRRAPGSIGITRHNIGLSNWYSRVSRIFKLISRSGTSIP